MSNNDGPAPYKSVVRLSVDCLTRLAKGKNVLRLLHYQQ